MWKVDWDNDVSNGAYVEWWTVSNGDVTFKADTEDGANWLANVLNEKPQNQPDE